MVGVDLGTTATKALALTSDGEVLAESRSAYRLSVPEQGAAELDPREVREAALEATGACVAEADAEVSCICFSSAMHSLVALDGAGEPLTACLTFADERSSGQARSLREGPHGRELYERTGTPVYAMSPLSKLVWLSETGPEVFHRAARFASIKEFVLAGFSDEVEIDASSASGTGLYSLARGSWDDLALDCAGIEEGRLPPIAPVHHRVELHREAAAALGLGGDVPVVIGAADGPLANLGTGVLAPDVLSVTVGTSGAVRNTVTDPRSDPAGALFCYVLDDRRFVVGGPINNGGVVVTWLGGLLFPDGQPTHAEDLDELAGGVEAGSNGLVVLPFLTGERAPLWSSEARGVMFGLSLQHGRGHVARAAMEGVAYALRTVADLLEPLAGTAREIRAGGGFVRSQVWVQILADVMGKPVTVGAHPDSSTIGAALMGLVATGELDPAEIGPELLGPGKTYEPDPRTAGVYGDTLALYRALSSELRDAFRVSASLGYEHPERRAGPSVADQNV